MIYALEDFVITLATIFLGVAGLSLLWKKFFSEKDEGPSKPITKTSIMKRSSDEPWGAAFAKPIMFIGWLLFAYAASPYYGQYVLNESPELLAIYLGCGIAFWWLGNVVSWKNDKSKKTIAVMYALLLIVYGSDWMMTVAWGPEDSFLMRGKSYSEVPRYGNSGVKHAPAAKQLYDLPEASTLKSEEWQKLKGSAGKLYIAKVKDGDVVQIINASAEWSIGLQTSDGEIHEENYSAKRGIEMPINADGNLFFKLPANSSLRYRIS